MDRQYDDEKKGYLWHENNSVIERKGSFTIEGKKYYGAIVKSHNDKGEFKYEFMSSLGLLHLNEEKRTEKSPDMGGKVTINNRVYKLGCWARESEGGSPYTSLGFTEVAEEGEYTERPKAAF
jgi:hypothetical protein|tara:strand:- start:106 stop:471 length:366 start_codon:yes stop_codon:yes gene_type:complete